MIEETPLIPSKTSIKPRHRIFIRAQTLVMMYAFAEKSRGGEKKREKKSARKKAREKRREKKGARKKVREKRREKKGARKKAREKRREDGAKGARWARGLERALIFSKGANGREGAWARRCEGAKGARFTTLFAYSK